MGLNIIPLRELIKSNTEEEDIKTLLFSFSSNPLISNGTDVEFFLHNKAIQFEKNGFS